MATYTQPSDLAKLDPKALAAQLRTSLAAGVSRLAAMPDRAASLPLAEGKWSVKQTIGHLIDSAGNNLQRIVRLQIESEISFPGYRQAEWVGVQRYDLLPWAQVLDTWHVLNLHLAHVVEHIDPAHLSRVWHNGENLMTLGFIVEDYIAHMTHHLDRLPGRSGA